MLLAWLSCSFNEVEYGSGSSLSSAGTRLRPHCWWADRPGSCCQTRSSRYLRVEIRKRGLKIRFWYSRCTVMMQKKKKKTQWCGLVPPSLDSPEPWVKSSWYCLFGNEAGKILDTRGLRDRGERETSAQDIFIVINFEWKKCLVKIILKSKTYE